MIEIIVIGAATLAVFSLFVGVMALKVKRDAANPPIHTCANRGGCRCGNRHDGKDLPDEQRSCAQKNLSATRRV